MKAYEKYSYIYPPRPEVKISSDSLNKFDDLSMVGQPKFNGSCCEIYLNDKNIVVKNRHLGSLGNFKLKNDEVNKLLGDGWRVFVGEYMNKSKKDSNNIVWNNKFVIFDILVNNNIHLIGSTYEERLNLLDNMFNYTNYNPYLNQITDNIFYIKSFQNNFLDRYNEIVKIDMLEGLVLKRKSGKLVNGGETANREWQLKCRKSCRLYKF